MANTLKSWMILNNVTADLQVAGETGAHQFDTTLLRPYYDDGSNNVPWRAGAGFRVFSSNSLISMTTGAAYAPFPDANSGYQGQLDFSRFREARILAYGNIQVASTSATLKLVDTTNTVDLTGVITFNSATDAWKKSTWAGISNSTYAGDAVFEPQAIEGNAADVLRLYSITLELR